MGCFQQIHYQQLRVNQEPLYIPYVDLQRGEGPTVLITAGMDGDEYAGQEAAKRLCFDFQKDQSWKGRRVIFPLVNIQGNAVGTSVNPYDNKFPKHIFPGKVSGTISEKIIYSVIQYINAPIDVWIDLHGGSSVEELRPFVWGFSYGSNKIRTKTRKLLSQLSADVKVLAPWNKVKNIAQNGIVYIILEAGQLGEKDEESIHHHVKWVHEILDNSQKKLNTLGNYYSTIRYYLAKYQGVWTNIKYKSSIRKNENLGILVAEGGNRIEKYIAREESIFLWRHKGGWVKKGEVLYAVGEKLSQ